MVWLASEWVEKHAPLAVAELLLESSCREPAEPSAIERFGTPAAAGAGTLAVVMIAGLSSTSERSSPSVFSASVASPRSSGRVTSGKGTANGSRLTSVASDGMATQVDAAGRGSAQQARDAMESSGRITFQGTAFSQNGCDSRKRVARYVARTQRRGQREGK